MTLALAFLADLIIGDPVYPCHPARLIGIMIEKGEVFLRHHFTNQKFAGMLLSLGLPLCIFIVVSFILYLLGTIHILLAMVFNVFGIYSALSIKDLQKEGMRVYQDLSQNNIEQARKSVARIVGRDTAHLNEQEITRAAVETIAESSVDGIIAPLFYAALGGAPLALAYKTINTLDSMIGHMSPRYRDFGFISAKQDDIFNWIPARLSYLIISIATLFTKHNTRKAFQTGWKDGVIAGYGNSAIPEATFAGALGVQLGGENQYQERTVKKTHLGLPNRKLDSKIILESLHLMMLSSWGILVFCLVIKGVYFG